MNNGIRTEDPWYVRPWLTRTLLTVIFLLCLAREVYHT